MLFKKRRNALNEKRRGRDNGNIGWTNMMNSVVKETTAEINKRLQAFENERMETKLKAIPENCVAFKVVKQLTGEKSKKAEDCKFVVNGRSIDSLEGKAKVMKEYYMELYKESTPTNELQPVIEEANVKVARWKSGITFRKDNSSLNPAESKWTITEEELQCARSRLNNKKSSGEDGLSNYIIKKLPQLFWEITRIIFNNCMANSYFPRM